MDVTYERCCGLDVHQKMVVACLMKSSATGAVQKETRTFSTMTADLLALADWLSEEGCTHVAMESTGVYWKPIYNLLEGLFELMVVNAQHIKTIPGRKTDVRDAEWVADLLRHGLLRGSFIPSAPQRELRELTRYRRTLVEERARLLNRVQKTLEDANLKLAAVVTDISGVSARAMLEALLAGQTDPTVLANLARGRLREKREALSQALLGRFKPHHAFMLTEHLSHLDYLSEAIERVNAELEVRLAEAEAVVTLLDTIPRISRHIAQVIVAELGADVDRFPSPRHLASWAGLCPGNNESAGKRYRGRTRKGSPYLRQTLVEAAHGAARTKDTYLSAQYRHIAARRGRRRALVALAHTLLTIVYYVLQRQEPYRELGGNYFDERDRTSVERRLVRRLQKLGYNVTIQPTALAG
jgi:transposase